MSPVSYFPEPEGDSDALVQHLPLERNNLREHINSFSSYIFFVVIFLLTLQERKAVEHRRKRKPIHVTNYFFLTFMWPSTVVYVCACVC